MNRKTKQIEKNERFFGVPLCQNGMEEKSFIFLESCIGFLESAGLETLQGLFRLCGNKTEIDEMKERVDEDIEFDVDEFKDPHNVAGLLKQFFRELPVPLIPFEFYRQFIEASTLSDGDTKKENIKGCISLLPSTNVYILGRLCIFMYEVQLCKETNLMSPENLSTCIGPNLLRTEENDPLVMVVDSVHVVSLFTLLIKEAHEFFPNIDKLRPKIRKRKESLQKINKQTFTVYLPPIDKKSVIINPSQPLSTVLHKICSVRKIKLDQYVPIDGSGNIVDLDKPLGDIEGRCITLVTEEEFKKQPIFSMDLPPEIEDNKTEPVIGAENSLSASKGAIHRTMSLGIQKSIPSIPKLVLSPRSDKNSCPSSAPNSAQRTLTARASLILSPHHSTLLTPRSSSTSSSSEFTPRIKKDRPKSYRGEPLDLADGEELDFAMLSARDKEGPPPPLYVPAPPPGDHVESTVPAQEKKNSIKRRKQRPSEPTHKKTPSLGLTKSKSEPHTELKIKRKSATFAKVVRLSSNKDSTTTVTTTPPSTPIGTTPPSTPIIMASTGSSKDSDQI